MGGTHKRNMRAEKAKVKLKGAKLPKGLNVTKTDFKVRKIMIREQLKESQYVDGLRQFNLKEILSRLKHHSSNFRLDAMRNLRESLANGTADHLLGNLNELIQGIAAISLDVEREARRESYKTLSSLFGILQEDAIAPFFHVISSYLRCAMTHIQTAIQEDALLMLDVLLQYTPRLLVAHSEKIFQNFLEMISRVRAEGDRANRTLTVNMGQQQTTIKWRTKVLQRLQRMFATLVAQKKDINASKSSDCLMATYNAKNPQHFSLKRRFPMEFDMTEILSRTVANTIGRNTNSTPNSTNVASNESQVLRHYVEHLLPLLLETWLEVRPQAVSNTSADKVLLTTDAALTLKTVLEIIEHLWLLIDKQEIALQNNELSTWLRNEYADVFSINFLDNSFPYQQQKIQKSDKKLDKRTAKSSAAARDIGEFCIQQNLSIAHLICRFYKQPSDQHTQQFSSLLTYLHTIVNHLAQHNVSADCQAQLILTLRAYLLHNALSLLELQPQAMRQLLHQTVNAYLSNHFTTREGVNSNMLVLLCEIVKRSELYKAFGGADEFNEFLNYLPQLLLKPAVSESALLAMSDLGKQQNALFLNALTPLIGAVTANIQQIQVNGAYNAFEGKKHIMNLFYWTKRDWHAEDLLQQLETHVTDKRIVSYFSFILKP